MIEEVRKKPLNWHCEIKSQANVRINDLLRDELVASEECQKMFKIVYILLLNLAKILLWINIVTTKKTNFEELWQGNQFLYW